eukprot:4706115-Amphidinium_carterae.2
MIWKKRSQHSWQRYLNPTRSLNLTAELLIVALLRRSVKPVVWAFTTPMLQHIDTCIKILASWSHHTSLERLFKSTFVTLLTVWKTEFGDRVSCETAIQVVKFGKQPRQGYGTQLA